MPKPKSSRMSRRYSLLDIIAQRITGIEGYTWNNFSTRFTSAVLPRNMQESDLDNVRVTDRIIGVLEDAIQEAKGNAPKYQAGKAEDLVRMLQDNPRKVKGESQ